ncbi:MAG: alpha-glucosidase C-terminal domain-containing protein, partial [Caldilineaceae bacterium]|nr:alpha-glucosidase C-terminal domain-containing protein [Caldilineaceae bacterium]
AFPWHEPAEWNQDLLHFYRQVTALRHQYAALRIGDFKTLHAENDVYAFRRNCEWQSVIVAFNADTQPIKATIPSGGFYEDGRTLRTVWPAQAQPASYTVSDGKLKQVTIGARSAVVLVAE